MRRILYEDIAFDIKEKILNGTYEVGSYIPAEHELEKLYNVSKITVRKAIEILDQEGYVKKMSGKGTEVISNRIFNKLSKAESFTAVLEGKGIHVSRRILSVDVITDLKMLPDDFVSKHRCIRVRRLFELDGIPYIYFDHYVPYGDNYEAIYDVKQSLYTWMQDNGHSIVDIRDAFSIEESDDAKAHLDLKHPYVMARTRYAYNHYKECIEYSVAYYDTSQHPYEIVYKV